MPDWNCDNSTPQLTLITCADEAAFVGVSVAVFAGSYLPLLTAMGSAAFVDFVTGGMEYDQCIDELPGPLEHRCSGLPGDTDPGKGWVNKNPSQMPDEILDGFCYIWPFHSGCSSGEEAPEEVGEFLAGWPTPAIHEIASGVSGGEYSAGGQVERSAIYIVPVSSVSEMATAEDLPPLLRRVQTSGQAHHTEIRVGWYESGGSRTIMARYYAEQNPQGSRLYTVTAPLAPGAESFLLAVHTNYYTDGYTYDRGYMSLYGGTVAHSPGSVHCRCGTVRYWNGFDLTTQVVTHGPLAGETVEIGFVGMNLNDVREAIDEWMPEWIPEWVYPDTSEPPVSPFPVPEAPPAVPVPWPDAPGAPEAPEIDPAPEPDQYEEVSEGTGDEGLFDRLANRIGSAINNVVNAIGSVAGWVVGQLGALLEWLLDQIRELFQWLGDLIEGLLLWIGELLEWLGGLLEQVIDAIEQMTELLGWWVQGLIDAIFNAIGSLGDLLNGALQSAIDVLSSIWDALAEIPGQIGEAIGEALSTLGQAIIDGIQAVIELLFIPDSLDLDGIGDECEQSFPCSWIAEFADALELLGAGVGGAAEGACTTPAIGWSEFRASLPPPSGCSVNGDAAPMGGEASTAGDLWGYRTAFRSLAFVVAAWVFITAVIQMTPWAESRYYRLNPTQLELF